MALRCPSTTSTKLPAPARSFKLGNAYNHNSRSESTIYSTACGRDDNTDPCPSALLLKLPNEILTEIIHRLSPRDAIALSFTCHFLHDGLLSHKNHFLWHSIGRFKEQLPGYSSEWYPYVQKRAKFERSKASRRATDDEIFTESISANTTFAEQPGPGNFYGSLPFTPRPPIISTPEYLQVHNTIKIYDPEFYVDYKGMLLSAMRGQGDVRECCQWCLQPSRRYAWEPIMQWRRRRTTWDKEKLDWITDTIAPPSSWICCVPCRGENYIFVDKARKLGIDLEGVGVHDNGQTYYYWKPTIQRRVVKRYGQGATISYAHEQWEKELLQLPAYRDQHFTHIFAAIKALYSAKAKTDTKLWALKKIIKPEHLRKEWFFATCPEGKTESTKLTWKMYCTHDRLMGILRHPEIGNLWKDHKWVKEHAESKLRLMVQLLTRGHSPQAQDRDIPTKKLIQDVADIALEVPLKMLQAAGMEGLCQRQRMTKPNDRVREKPRYSRRKNSLFLV